MSERIPSLNELAQSIDEHLKSVSNVRAKKKRRAVSKRQRRDRRKNRT